MLIEKEKPIIKVKYGNLVKAKATFIVNASNTELILGSGVSKAFRQQCGSFYQQEVYEAKEVFLQQYDVINQGDVVLSGSGQANNFQFALHFAVMNYTDDSRAPYPTYEQIQKGLENIAVIVNRLIYEKDIETPVLAIPLLGCGTGGLDKERVFSMIYSYFKSITCSWQILIYVYDLKDYLKFKFEVMS